MGITRKERDSKGQAMAKAGEKKAGVMTNSIANDDFIIIDQKPRVYLNLVERLEKNGRVKLSHYPTKNTNLHLFYKNT
jgi:hypothetical protein